MLTYKDKIELDKLLDDITLYGIEGLTVDEIKRLKDLLYKDDNIEAPLKEIILFGLEAYLSVHEQR